MEELKLDHATFEEGVERIKKALEETGTTISNEVITSQDININKLLNRLAGDNKIKGINKWQLPFVFPGSQFFISVSQPDISVPKHSHDGVGLRVIISGSIFFKDKELKGGDWMYIPKGAKYEIKVGSYGVVMFYCYCCCCVPKRLNESVDVLNENPYTKY